MATTKWRHRRFRDARLAGALSALALVALIVPMTAAAAPQRHLRRGGGQLRLTATDTGSGYAPTFTGSGVLGVRVPPAGQGYAPGTVPALSELAGFYAQPKGEVEQRANVPTWSTLVFRDGGRAFEGTGPAAKGWRQTLDLRTGIISTSASFTGPDGHVTDLRYEVLTDRARPHLGLVRLQLTPHWSGTATVDDRFDGRPAELNVENKPGGLTEEIHEGREGGGQWLALRAIGTEVEATLADRLLTSANVAATSRVLKLKQPMSIGRRLRFPVTAGETYTVTKVVDVESSEESEDSQTDARRGASIAAAAGWAALRSENAQAWDRLWSGRVVVRGEPRLARAVAASQFYLWSSTNRGIDWSISPAGLSSNGYNGHIFWDAETWMFPTLLAQHPALAEAMNSYRFDRLAQARRHAKSSGFVGARFPWESALDGTEQIPPPASINSEGLFEQHIVADVALAHWQYYLATGDEKWLASRGWPVIAGAALFWAGRAMRGMDGGFHITHVTGPDEENPNVADEAYTNVAAKTVLEDATAAAKVLGKRAPGGWAKKAAGLVVPFDPALGINPEFRGYHGQLVKQADVTLMQYPWGYQRSPRSAQANLDYYVARSDPGGPSMTDAVSMIDSAALGTPGCSAFVYTERSYEPFIKDVFSQFSETRDGGAFTFMTGIGGFVQEFLYGYSGLRWERSSVRLDPALNSQLGGVVLHDLRWRGRRFEVAIGRHRTKVTLEAGAPLPVTTREGRRLEVREGRPLSLPTRRPDLAPTSDPLRCTAPEASTAGPGAPALAAVDGSPATGWEPTALPATLTVPLGETTRLDGATLRWGRSFPTPPKPNVHPPAHPVLPRRASAYTLLGSRDGHRWRILSRVGGRKAGTVDRLRFAPTSVRFLRLKATAATGGEPPQLDELTATR